MYSLVGVVMGVSKPMVGSDTLVATGRVRHVETQIDKQGLSN